MKFQIAIPSLGRATTLQNHPMVEHANLCVAEREIDWYKKICGDGLNYRVYPDTIRGISQTRNWILDNVRQDDDDFILMMDDDVLGIEYGMTTHSRKSHDPIYIKDVMVHVAQLAIDAGAGVFGFPRNIRYSQRTAMLPFSLRRWVDGCCMGVIDRELRYDEKVIGKDDFDLCIQVLHKKRIVWLDERWSTIGQHWKLTGGLTTQRTTETEREDVAYLQRKWGRSVVQTNRRQQKNGLYVGLGIK
jgi:hypothetical protein